MIVIDSKLISKITSMCSSSRNLDSRMKDNLSRIRINIVMNHCFSILLKAMTQRESISTSIAISVCESMLKEDLTTTSSKNTSKSLD